jgi:hypothetical protein
MTGGRRPGKPLQLRVSAFGNLPEHQAASPALRRRKHLRDRTRDALFCWTRPCTTLTQVVQEVSTRVGLFRLPGLYPLLDLLYRDPSTGRPKKGHRRHRAPPSRAIYAIA